METRQASSCGARTALRVANNHRLGAQLPFSAIAIRPLAAPPGDKYPSYASTRERVGLEFSCGLLLPRERVAASGLTAMPCQVAAMRIAQPAKRHAGAQSQTTLIISA